MTDPWEELVSVALMGTERRRLDVDSLPAVVRSTAMRLAEPDPGALLSVAALVHAAERAGRRPGPAGELLVPSGPETREPVPARAAGTLTRILQLDDVDLLAEWLGLVASRGMHVPHGSLPGLLDLATAQPGRVREPLVGALGERGRWLAALRPEWRGVLAEARGRDSSLDPAASRELWSHGDLPTRVAWLRAARGHDPGAALEVLRSGWSTEPPTERAAFVAELVHGLSPDDEPFLESLLDDSRAEVRRGAADLLRLIPTSAYADRMLARATAWVRIDKGMLRSRLVVEPVDERSADLKRDQVPDPPKGSGGRGAWFLEQVLARVDLVRFASALGADASRVVSLSGSSDWSGPLLTGLTRAALVGGDPSWAAAVLDHVPAADLGLVRHLPAADQARAVRAVTARSWDPIGLQRLAAELPRPWSADLALAVVGVTAQRVATMDLTTTRALLTAVAHATPQTDAAPVVAALRDRMAAPDTGSAAWADASHALDVLSIRYRMLEELS